ncbi:uracil-xanthine permease [Lacrimispora sphenoides]|uniref:Uracil permease n=2 Tax=Lacrimispora sphenoides TaxID=29370 RepID=A0ABY1CG97_9FIRM|nr:uracil permease [Lacrimispora sphenoides]SEU02267.1 uracil permease [[Clostridium] sphenoides JCM 1415]SUY48649.1 uracil-xanthine permease [Lacrimispora sphenoides]
MGKIKNFKKTKREMESCMESKKIIQVEEKVPFKLLVPLSIQHMFAMFGASVLVPFIFGINPAVVLFMNGMGTLFFIFITKGKAPAYLGSSFAFLAPAGIVISKWGYNYALGGFVAVGICGCVVALIIYKFGSDWIDIVLPPAAMGPVVALIGLELAGTAAANAGLKDEMIDMRNVIVFLVTLLTAVLGSVVFRKFLSVIPILVAIIVGYVAALLSGVVDFSEVSTAAWLSLPNFAAPKFKWEAIVIILPVLLVVTSEHIGHQIVTSKIVDRDLIKDPGLHRSLLGDYISTTLSGLVGSVPTTTYGENIGVMAMTKVYSVYVIGGAAVLSVACSFIGKMTTLINTIPGPVIGGISFLLYGMIGASGIRILVDAQVDYGKSRNMAMTSVIFVTGLSGVAVKFGSIQLSGMVLACVVGMLMGLMFFVLDKLNLTNDRDHA